jgi:F-type H+-transporting ATPase subunit b
MLELNPGLILWTLITFILVLAILRAFAWKPLLGALNEREEKIRSSLAHAEEAQKQAALLLETHKRQLAQAEEQAQRLIKEGREMGDRLKSEILEKANASSRHMIDQAREEIRREKDAALTQLRTEVADLAVTAAGKLLDANLDTPKQRQLVDAAINDITRSRNG